MNILYINHYAGSLDLGMEFRPYYMAQEWTKAGHRVRVVAADFSHLRSKNPEVSKDYEIMNIDGIEYQWLKTRTYESNGVKRAITMVQFCSKLYFGAAKIVKEFKPDLVITSSTYPLDTYPAQRIAKMAKARYVHEGHDLWPLTLTELMGMSKWNPFVILMGMAERSVYKNATHVVSVLPFSYKHMLQHGLKSVDKFTHIPNGIVIKDWLNPIEAPEEHTRLFNELRSQGKSIVCYLGGHAPSNALDTLVDAALKNNDNRFAFVLIGKGNQKQRLMKKAEGAKNIYFLPPVSKMAVPTVLSMADFLYIGAEKCDLYRFGVSMNKVYDYMMAAKPIIYGVEAANNDVLDAECGFTIKPDAPEDICKVLDELVNMSQDEKQIMGEKGRKWVLENCSYAVLAARFLEVSNKN